MTTKKIIILKTSAAAQIFLAISLLTEGRAYSAQPADAAQSKQAHPVALPKSSLEIAAEAAADHVLGELQSHSTVEVHFPLPGATPAEPQFYDAVATRAFLDCAASIRAQHPKQITGDGDRDLLAGIFENSSLKRAQTMHLSLDDQLAILDYSEDYFDLVNKALWSQDPAEIKPIKCFADQLSAALGKFPDFKDPDNQDAEGNALVFRGTEMPVGFLSAQIPGNTSIYRAFTSTSSTGISQTYMDQPVQMTIHSKHGKDITDFTNAGADEDEVLFQPGTQLKTIRRHPSKNDPNVTWIELEEVD